MESLLAYFDNNLKKIISEKCNFDNLIEIRLRANKPLILFEQKREIICESTMISQENINAIFDRITDFSSYAHLNEIRNGYITIKGGHRIGLAGYVIENNGTIENFKKINSMNLRIFHPINGCSDQIFDELFLKNKIRSILIVSPPGLGKTTLLRDLIKNISNNISGTSICVIDERLEISGVYNIDLGFRTDVISGCEKSKGIDMAIRSMAPKIIAVDEIGGKADIKSLKKAAQSGINIIATIHGDNVRQIKNKLGQDAFYMFENIVLIKEIGCYECIKNI